MTKTFLPTMNIQETIEKLLRATNREHVEELLTIMRDNGYYRVGCHGHHRRQGGLAQHSLEVLLRMQRQNDSNIPTTSIIVVALLHDLCKISGFNEIRHHGSRSVLIATREAGFKLTSMEYQAILWHMHGTSEKGKLGSQFDAVLDNPIWKLLRKADHYSAAHPMTKEELVYAMNGKPRTFRRVLSVHAYACNAGISNRLSPKESSAPKVELTAEEKRQQAIRRSTASLADVLAALEPLNITREQAIEILSSQQQPNRTRAEYEKHDRGFNYSYWLKASANELEDHRTILFDKCQGYGAPKRVARYIFEETNGVFNTPKIDDFFAWLQEEFNLGTSASNFYHACNNFDNYKYRK